MGFQSRSHKPEKKSSTSGTSQSSLRSRGFAPPPKQEEIMPDIQTQLERARRLGHRMEHYMATSTPPTPLPIQAKLTIGAPGDIYEQEADRVATEVVERINTPVSTGESVQREAMTEAEDELQMKPLADSIQRVEIDDQEELQMKSQVPRREAIEGGDASTDLDIAINSDRGSGQPLDAGLKQSMGQVMGADFSEVRVHIDAQADQLNQSLQAKAFTTGQDVFFRQGAYQPGSRGGQELIAHELTHVVQQNGAAVQRSPIAQKQLSQHYAMETPSGSVGEGVIHSKGEIRGNAIIQRRLNKESEEIFRKKMLELIPTLPEEVLQQIIEKYGPKQHIQAIKDAKSQVEKIEALALKNESGEASISKASRSLVAELITAYDPKEHHYVLLGGSPAVLDKALSEQEVSFSHLPLGGLTDAEKQQKALGGTYEGESLRAKMLEYLKKAPNLQKYLGTFLDGIKIENLVLIDYTQSGGSIIVTADLLRRITKKTVKLFTFSGKQPEEDNALTTQTDYDLVSLSPLGADERTFVTMTDSKYYKDKLGLVAYQSLTLSILESLSDSSYESVLKRISNEEGQKALEKL